MSLKVSQKRCLKSVQSFFLSVKNVPKSRSPASANPLSFAWKPLFDKTIYLYHHHRHHHPPLTPLSTPAFTAISDVWRWHLATFPYSSHFTPHLFHLSLLFHLICLPSFSFSFSSLQLSPPLSDVPRALLTMEQSTCFCPSSSPPDHCNVCMTSHHITSHPKGHGNQCWFLH